MLHILSVLSNGILGAGGVLAICFGVAGILSVMLSGHGDVTSIVDAGSTLLASR